MLYSFLIYYACSHKDIAHLLVEIYCLKVVLSIPSLQSLVGALCVAVDTLVSIESEAKPADTD
jgi:hypothetical protein